MAAAITVGSIITLLNNAPGDGFLDTRGWVADKQVVTTFHDPQIRALVSTNEGPNRSVGSGSWRILSAKEAPDGTPLRVGDAIHLLSMHAGVGYLDSFEWVTNLAPFASYTAMTIGVFTASVPKRGGGLSGTWTIWADKVGEDTQICEGDLIYLRNEYPAAGFLRTYGTIGNHELFKEYVGQRSFVFTDASARWAGNAFAMDSPDGALPFRWTIASSDLLERMYRVQLQWGATAAPWHDGGVFTIGDRTRPPVVALTLASTDEGATLSGQVTYRGDATPLLLTARHTAANVYAVAHGPGETSAQQEQWVLGARDAQLLVALAVSSSDEGRSLAGVLTYAGEGPVGVKARRGITTIDDTPELLQGRTSKIAGVIDSTYRLLAGAFKEIGGIELHDVDRDAKLQHLADHGIDRRFQLDQLLQLHALTERMQSFLRDTLQESIRQSLKQHRVSRTLPPLHLFRACFQQLATDYELVQQAIIQRRWNLHRDNQYYMSEQALGLLVMDKLAIKAVAPFHELLPVDQQPVIISYLSEETHFRRLPYTDRLLLIGVSYDRLPSAASVTDVETASPTPFDSAFELLAIPHEVGHYIYRYGTLTDGTTFPALSEQIARNNPYWRWCEEIFADVYGCIVAGPLTALGMQALLASIDKERAWKDDEVHPTPALRIFILAEVLRVLEQLEARRASTTNRRVKAMIDTLDHDWSTRVGLWGYERLGQGDGRPARIFVRDDNAPQLDRVVNVERVIAAVRPIIIEFARRLLDRAATAAPAGDEIESTRIPWSSNNYASLAQYNSEIAKLSDRSFAGKKVVRNSARDANELLTPPDQADPDGQLQRFLDDWGERGPLGSSGGTHR